MAKNSLRAGKAIGFVRIIGHEYSKSTDLKTRAGLDKIGTVNDNEIKILKSMIGNVDFNTHAGNILIKSLKKRIILMTFSKHTIKKRITRFLKKKYVARELPRIDALIVDKDFLGMIENDIFGLVEWLKDIRRIDPKKIEQQQYIFWERISYNVITNSMSIDDFLEDLKKFNINFLADSIATLLKHKKGFIMLTDDKDRNVTWLRFIFHTLPPSIIYNLSYEISLDNEVSETDADLIIAPKNSSEPIINLNTEKCKESAPDLYSEILYDAFTDEDIMELAKEHEYLILIRHFRNSLEKGKWISIFENKNLKEIRDAVLNIIELDEKFKKKFEMIEKQ